MRSPADALHQSEGEEAASAAAATDFFLVVVLVLVPRGGTPAECRPHSKMLCFHSKVAVKGPFVGLFLNRRFEIPFNGSQALRKHGIPFK